MTSCAILLNRRSVLLGAAALSAASALTGPAAAQGTPPVAVVIGTSSGFGRLTAETLARAGFHVAATMRDIGGRNAEAAADLRALAAAEGLALEIIEIDVTDEASVASGVTEAVALTGRIDVLVNNAGLIVPGPVELSLDAARLQFDTNVLGQLRMLRAVLPAMRAQGTGLVVHVSSGLGRFVIPTQGIYCATKFAGEAMMEAAMYELHPFGIEVAIVQPGEFATRFKPNGRAYLAETLATLSPEDAARASAYADHLARTEAGMADSPTPPAEEVADAILRLAQAMPGARETRTPVMPPEQAEGLAQLNGVLMGVQEGILQGSGFGDWLSLRA